MPAIAGAGSGGTVQVKEIIRDDMREVHLTQPQATAESITSMESDSQLQFGAGVVAAECFGPNGGVTGLDDLRGVPLTWVKGRTSGDGLGGVHLRAVAGIEIRPLMLDGWTVGTVVEGPHAVECMLAGIHADDLTDSAPLQARAAFERIEEALALAEMDFSHVVRTWLFLDDILAWYPEFNVVRTTFFTERGVFDRMVPASTGIGGANPMGAAMVAGAYAVKAKSPEVRVEALPSPLQCPALQYGSSFSRAAEVDMPDIRRVFVSGTASIAPGGDTVHIGDVAAQAARTCEVIEAILRSRGMSWEDVTRATAYVRYPEDAGVLEEHRIAAGIPEFPVIVAHNVICRQDLLFELEVDAVQVR